MPVHVKLPSKEYDEAYARAQEQHVSVPELIRREWRERVEKQKT